MRSVLARLAKTGGKGMTVAIWIIAVCEVVRALQNAIQLRTVKQDKSARQNVYSEFIKSLKNTDKEFVENMLKEWEQEVTE